MDVNAYLQRIGYDGPVARDFATLRALHGAHVRSIAYENFDVQLKRRSSTDVRAAYEKIVERRRGGWCYEMNGVFGWALGEIGFDVTRLAGDGSAPGSHLVLRVDLDGQPFVADVGFADGPAEPYPLVEGPFIQNGFAFRVEMYEDGTWRLHNHRFGVTPGFVAGAPDEAAMAETCTALQNDPQSPFVQNVTVFRRTDEGLISLIGRVLRTIRPDGVDKALIADADEFVATLKDRFDLDLPETAQLWPSICIRHEEVLSEQAARRAAAQAQS